MTPQNRQSTATMAESRRSTLERITRLRREHDWELAQHGKRLLDAAGLAVALDLRALAKEGEDASPPN